MRNPSTCMKLDESASYSDYQEAVDERLSKASAVMLCLLANDNWTMLNKTAVTNALWAIDTLIDEAKAASKAAWESRPGG